MREICKMQQENSGDLQDHVYSFTRTETDVYEYDSALSSSLLCISSNYLIH